MANHFTKRKNDQTGLGKYQNLVCGYEL